MSTQFDLRTSRSASDPLTAPKDSVNAISDPGADNAFVRVVAAMRAGVQSGALNHNAFFNQVADQARQSTNADSAVLALRQSEMTVCIARSGPIGPPPGAQMDSRSGMSGECLRHGRSLRCKDSEADARVDAEVCRKLGIRSLVVVPVFEGRDVVGLIEVFSSRPNAFQNQHVAMLEQLASLIAEPRARSARDLLPSVAQNSPVPIKREQGVPRIPDPVMPVERRGPWAKAFSLRPYQIAIVIGFLVLDLVTVYFWRWR
jgi:transcriptional regulator with GAF, ATPase, and Fis domain